MRNEDYIFTKKSKLIIIFMSGIERIPSPATCFTSSQFLKNPTKLNHQGTDACLEQIIKRSKKGAKIQVNLHYSEQTND